MVEYALELSKNGYPINIFVNDTSKSTAGFWVSDYVKYFITPKVENDEDEYINVLFNKCQKNNIDLIIPLMDFEIPILAKNKDLFRKKNIEIVVSEYNIVKKCLDKKRNYKFCIENNINVPKTFFSESEIDVDFPLILKKIKGSGSIGQKIIRSYKEIDNFNAGEDLLQTFIKGQEYGMDVFNDLNGNYLHSFTREKLLMRGGETDKAKAVYSKKNISLGKRISEKFKHVGNMDIDYIKDNDGKIYFIDFNPRFGGGYPLTHISGFNYLKAIIDIFMNNTIEFPDTKSVVYMMKGLSVHSYT